MNRPSCYGTTAKRSPYYRNHQCMNCLYILDCIEKEKMLEQTKTNPSCFGTQPKPNTVLWKERMCGICPCIKQCYAETHSTVGSTTSTKLDKDKQMTLATAWLDALHRGSIEAPDADGVRFEDGSSVVWDGKSWELGTIDQNTLSAPEVSFNLTRLNKDKPDWTCPDCNREYVGHYDINTHRVMMGCGKTKT